MESGQPFQSRPRVLTASLSFESDSQSVPHETLTKILANGGLYLSEIYGVQLSVLRGTFKTPREAENLVELEPAAKILTCRDKQYFAHLIMRQCGAVGKDGRKPFLFDSFIQDVDGNDVPSVSEILEEYQVGGCFILSWQKNDFYVGVLWRVGVFRHCVRPWGEGHMQAWCLSNSMSSSLVYSEPNAIGGGLSDVPNSVSSHHGWFRPVFSDLDNRSPS